MKNAVQKKKQEGFTIIEVLIVLAIAGLIILIVFLAVPSLQRNSRNTQRKNDVSALSGAYSEYVNNNNGKAPATEAVFISDVLSNAKLSSYELTAANLDYEKLSAAPSTPPTQTNVENITIRTFLKCDGNSATASGASARSAVILYAVETGGGTPTQQCTEI